MLLKVTLFLTHQSTITIYQCVSAKEADVGGFALSGIRVAACPALVPSILALRDCISRANGVACAHRLSSSLRKTHFLNTVQQNVGKGRHPLYILFSNFGSLNFSFATKLCTDCCGWRQQNLGKFEILMLTNLLKI